MATRARVVRLICLLFLPFAATARRVSEVPVPFASAMLSPWAGCLLLIAGAIGIWWFLHLRVRSVADERKRQELAVAERTRQLCLEKAHVLEEKARAEKQNRKIERLLEQAQEASCLKGEFLANMSH